MQAFLPCLILSFAWGASVFAAEPQPKNFAYLLQAEHFRPSREETVRALAASNRDWIILDRFFGGDSPWKAEEIQAIRQARPGRKLIAYVSIGEAEDYRPYWGKDWKKSPPPFLLGENPGWKGNFRVKYWNKDWQEIILKDIDSLLSQNFDGIYLDIVDGFEFFEFDPATKNWNENAENPETGRSYREDMKAWVATIAEHCRQKNPAFLVVPQNASQLLSDPAFVQKIDAIGVEDLFTDGHRRQDRDHLASVSGPLQAMFMAGKPVLLIEYCKKKELAEDAESRAKKMGAILLITDRELKTLGRPATP